MCWLFFWRRWRNVECDFASVRWRHCVGAQWANAQAARSAPSNAAGTTFTYTVTSNARDSNGTKLLDGQALVRMQNGNVRMDYSRGTALVCCTETNRSPEMQMREGWPGTDDGGYLLMNSAASWYVVVTDRTRTYRSFVAQEFAMAVFPPAIHGSPVFTDGIFTFKDLGTGDKILGHATRRVQVATKYKVGISSDIAWLSDRADTTDIWLAFGAGVDENSLVTWAETFGVGAYFNNPLLAQQRESYLRKFGCRGFPLRIVTRIRHPFIGGGTIDTVRVEVTDLNSASLDTSFFQVPNEYRHFGRQSQGPAGYGVTASYTVPRSQRLPANANRFCRESR